MSNFQKRFSLSEDEVIDLSIEIEIEMFWKHSEKSWLKKDKKNIKMELK